ncbi:UPF0175 family protein [Leptothermofonsia sp. ETS-13]|uniref:UPF0175 family protein n=1 Tax=Leptothermofonsia sp. ETS-13 TaxID=3035696 RepID=UPI003BA30859
MSLVISDDLVRASGFSENELFLEIVLMLFRQDKISLGKASELVGLHRMQFQNCWQIEISVSIMMSLSFKMTLILYRMRISCDHSK